MPSPLKIQVFIKGRPMAEYTFFEETVTIGRDPRSKIVIDNAGISRDQARIVPSPDGWMLEDQGSANGTWLNQQRVQLAPLKDRDEITIGKFTLSLSLEADRTVRPIPQIRPRRNSPAEVDGTTVLTRGQLASILASMEDEQEALRSAHVAAPAAQTAPAGRLLGQRLRLSGMIVLAMVLGAILARLLAR